MKTKKIWANLPVENVEETRRFYLEIGFKPNSPPDAEDIASFLVGEDDFVLHFWNKQRFEQSVHGNAADLSQGNEIIFTLSADSKDEVDRWVDEVREAGGTIFFDPRESEDPLYTEHGYYSCGFSDPDGHKFNVFYNSNN